MEQPMFAFLFVRLQCVYIALLCCFFSSLLFVFFFFFGVNNSRKSQVSKGGRNEYLGTKKIDSRMRNEFDQVSRVTRTDTRNGIDPRNVHTRCEESRL